MKVHNLLVTGSLTSGGENITAISSSVSSTVTSLSSSVSTSIGSLSSSMVSSMTSLSSSLTSSMGSLSSSMASSMTSLSSSLTGSMGSLSSSMVTSMNSLSSSMGSIMATTGSNLFKGDQTISGSIIPAVNSSYDLGSPTNEFRHLYLSSASLYIDGTKVLGSTTQELQITTDTGQSFKILEAGSDTITLQAADGNITLATSGGGDVILDPTSGVIALKGTTTLYAGNKILSSDGNAIQFGNSVTMTGSLIVTGFIETQELRTTYISSSILYRSGSTKFGDELSDTHDFTGSLNISGSVNAVGSNLVSGSSQITYGSINGIPSGIVSGSSQIDVLSTTNIARLATTGSNIFTSNQVVTGSISSTGNIKSEGVLQWNNGIGTLSYGGGAVTMETNTDAPILLKTNGTTAITISTGQTVTFANDILTGIDKGIKFDSSGASGHPEISVDSSVNLNFKNSAGLTNLRLKNNGELIVSGSINIANGSATNTFNINQPGSSTTEFHLGHFSNGTYISNNYYYSGGHLYTDNTLGSSTILLDTNGIYLRASGANAVPGNHMFISGSGLIGINDINPSKKLTVNFGTSVSDGLLVTGSQRQETRFKSSGEHSNVFIDSAHSNIFLPTLGLLRNGTSFGEVKLQRASNSDSVGSYTESEMIMGSTTTVPVSIKTNEVRRILVESGGIVNIYNQLNQRSGLRMNNGTGGSSPRITFGTEDEGVPGNKSIYLDNYWMILQPHVNEGLRVRFVNGSGTQTETVRLQSTQASFYTSISTSSSISASDNINARNFNKYVRSWSSNGSYVWSEQLDAISGYFDSAGWYKGFIRESNGAHYRGFYFDILVGQKGYGGLSSQYRVLNITQADSPYVGGCGGTSFAAIDNSGFTKQSSACYDSLELFITRLG